MNPETSPRQKNPDPAAFVTRDGLPLRIELEWPFHRSTSGADWQVLHGKARLLSDPEGLLHAEFSANFTQTMVAALPSLEPQHAEPVAINAVRIDADSGKLEFLKSGKRLPVEVSTRYMSFKTKQLRFLSSGAAELKNFLIKKLYWQSWQAATPGSAVWIADPFDGQYLGAEAEQFIAVARELEGEGLCKLQDDFAAAAPAIEREATRLRAELQHTLDRAVAKFNAAMRQ